MGCNCQIVLIVLFSIGSAFSSVVAEELAGVSCYCAADMAPCSCDNGATSEPCPSAIEIPSQADPAVLVHPKPSLGKVSTLLFLVAWPSVEQVRGWQVTSLHRAGSPPPTCATLQIFRC